MKILRRLATAACSGQTSCPAVFELDSGDYLIIGKTIGLPNITADDLLTWAASIGPDETAAVLPRAVMHAACADTPGA